MVLKLHWGQKKFSEPLEIEFFTIFVNFWVQKLKPFIGKVRQSVKNCLNQNFVIWAFSENGFEVTLKSKANFYRSLKIAFFRLLQIVDWRCWHLRESEVKHWKLFKSKFGHRNYFRKWFWSYLEVKNTNILSNLK